MSAIRKEGSLSRSHSDSYRRNRPSGDDVLRQTASNSELQKLEVCGLIHTSSVDWLVLLCWNISSRLDQVNSILYGAASKHINRLQRVQNALARVVTFKRPYTSPLSSTPLFQNLHWLPIEWRVHFKLATLAYNALHTGQHTLPVRTVTTL